MPPPPPRLSCLPVRPPARPPARRCRLRRRRAQMRQMRADCERARTLVELLRRRELLKRHVIEALDERFLQVRGP